MSGLLISAEANRRRQREVTIDRRDHLRSPILFPSAVSLITIVAFFPVVTTADVNSNALTIGRLLEIGLLGVACVLTSLALVRHPGKAATVSWGPLIAAAFALWAMLSSIWSVNSTLSLGRGMELALVTYIAFTLSIYTRNRLGVGVRPGADVLAVALLGTIAVMIVANVLIWGTPLKFSDPLAWSRRAGRLYFAHAHPLESAELIALAAIATSVCSRGPVLKLIAISILMTLLYLTNARNAMLFLPLTLLVVMYQYSSTKIRFLLVTGGVCGLLVVMAFAVFDELLTNLPRDIWTLNSRVPLWLSAAEIISDYPFLGVGYNASRHFLLSMFEFAGHAHNAYVETLLTTGFVGLGILLALLAYSVFVVRKSGDSLLLSMMVFICLASIFNPLILTPNPSSFCLLFALFLAAGPSVPSYAVDEPR